MKLLKKKNLFSLLYAFLICLPIFSIIGRVIYTQSNKNAKDSYYGANINQEVIESTDISNAVINQKYTLYTDDIVKPFNPGLTTSFYATDIYLNNTLREGYTRISISREPSGDQRYIISISGEDLNNIYVNYGSSNQILSFVFNRLEAVGFNFDLTYISYVDYSYLDNAFNYSLYTFVEDNSFGKVNFFTWFFDMFLTHNQVNNLYINFINWFMNYVLVVSLTYILFLVLMWFVSFIRRLLEKTSTYDVGGY